VARFLIVCVGGALGSGARFLLSTGMARAFGPEFPVGTLLVNVTGSFLIAVILELSLRTGAVSPDLRLFLTTGVMGGYTTYSSFNYETLRLAQDGSAGLAALNLGLTVGGCAAAGLLGVGAARLLAGLLAGR
jgi:fluoride exporter